MLNHPNYSAGGQRFPNLNNNLAVLLLQEDKDDKTPCSFAAAGAQELQNTLQFLLQEDKGFSKILAGLLLEEDKALRKPAVLLLRGGQRVTKTTSQFCCWRKPCMSFVVGRGQGFTQHLAVLLIGLTGWVKAGRVAGRSGKRLEERAMVGGRGVGLVGGLGVAWKSWGLGVGRLRNRIKFFPCLKTLKCSKLAGRFKFGKPYCDLLINKGTLNRAKLGLRTIVNSSLNRAKPNNKTAMHFVKPCPGFSPLLLAAWQQSPSHPHPAFTPSAPIMGPAGGLGLVQRV